MTTMETCWRDVQIELLAAKAITWDGCHKIYIAMDDKEVTKFISYGYDIIPIEDTEEALYTLQDWYDESCGLRFISSVRTVEGDPNRGFKNLIPQGAEEEGFEYE